MSDRARRLATLGLLPSATPAEVRAAWRKLMLRWHPDRHPRDPASQQAAHERAKEINEAYSALSGNAGRERPGPPPGEGRYRRSPFPSAEVPERPLRSRKIVSVGYDDRHRLLYVKYRKGVVHAYHDVPRPLFDGLLAARSPERYADEHLYGAFPSTRV